MKLSLLISIILTPACLLSQGFGSFSRDQPYLASSQSSFPLPTRALGFWWVASDITNSPVQIWQDRIQGRNFIQPTGASQPFWTNSLGVNFTGSQSMYLTNTIALSASDAVLIVTRPMANTGDYAEILFGQTNGFGFFWINFFGGAADLNYLDSTTTISTPVGLNKNYEILLAGTNNLGNGLIYTNGIASITDGTANGRSIVRIGVGGDGPQTGYFFNGRIEEIAIWTNVVLLTAQEIASIHQGVTNRWIFP